MHVRWAGVGGRLWLVLDAALHSKQIRLKIGGMIEEGTQLNRFSIGQGKRSGVHQFGVFTRALFDECDAERVWVGIGMPLAAVVACKAVRQGLTQHRSQSRHAVDEGELEERASNISKGRTPEYQHDWARLFADLQQDSGIRLLDFMAMARVEPQQFVDDTIVLASSAQVLRKANIAMSNFVEKWRHSYQGGPKGQGCFQSRHGD